MLLKGIKAFSLSNFSKLSKLSLIAPPITVRAPLVVRALPVRRTQATAAVLAAPLAFVSAAAGAASGEEDAVDVALREVDEMIAHVRKQPARSDRWLRSSSCHKPHGVLSPPPPPLPPPGPPPALARTLPSSIPLLISPSSRVSRQ